MYNFVKQSDLRSSDIISFLHGNIGILHIKDWEYNTENILNFGKIVPQDYYDQDVVKVGGAKDIWQDLAMPWHCDRGYSDNIDDVAALYCIEAEDGAGKTKFCDMQSPTELATADLLYKCEKSYWNKLSKYYNYEIFPVTYEKESHRRLHRLTKSKRPLIRKDSTGLFITYQQAYTICDFENDIESICYQDKYIYTHAWNTKDLLIFNNRKINHKRESTPKNIKRDLVRFAVTPSIPISQSI